MPTSMEKISCVVICWIFIASSVTLSIINTSMFVNTLAVTRYVVPLLMKVRLIAGFRVNIEPTVVIGDVNSTLVRS